MSDHQYKFNVSMSCGGCSGAVERILKRLEGSYTLNFPLAPALPSIPVD
jgi:copper chaperone